MGTESTCTEPDCGRRATNVGPYCGEHMRTRRYHEWRALSVEERFWARVDKDGPAVAGHPEMGRCWVWFGALVPDGHGMVMIKKKGVGAHAFAYTSTKGPIPDGLVIDHVCHNEDTECWAGNACLHRRCVNPDHLEAVTHAENCLRGKGPSGWPRRKDVCPRGHDLTDPANLKPVKGQPGRRLCKKCQAIYRRDRYLRTGK